jgi:hypothetical protein
LSIREGEIMLAKRKEEAISWYVMRAGIITAFVDPDRALAYHRALLGSVLLCRYGFENILRRVFR